MSAAIYPANYVGLGLLAFWLYVRFPTRRPRSIMSAMGRVVLSFALLMLLPVALKLCFSLVTSRGMGILFVIGAMMPTICFMLLSWFWLLGRVAGDLSGGKPRGGHPVSTS